MLEQTTNDIINYLIDLECDRQGILQTISLLLNVADKKDLIELKFNEKDIDYVLNGGLDNE